MSNICNALKCVGTKWLLLLLLLTFLWWGIQGLSCSIAPYISNLISYDYSCNPGCPLTQLSPVLSSFLPFFLSSCVFLADCCSCYHLSMESWLLSPLFFRKGFHSKALDGFQSMETRILYFIPWPKHGYVWSLWFSYTFNAILLSTLPDLCIWVSHKCSTVLCLTYWGLKFGMASEKFRLCCRNKSSENLWLRVISLFLGHAVSPWWVW